MRKITPEVFCPGHADASWRFYFNRLGRELSGWWLSKDLFQRAMAEGALEESDRKLPREPGTCVIWCEVNGKLGASHLLPAVPVVCRWEKDAEDSERLPPSLKRLAWNVRERLGSGNGQSGRFGLQLLPRTVDMSGFDDGAFTAESGMLSLMVGLLSARIGVQLNPTVGFSAWWSFEQGNWAAVKGLPAKAAAAAELGIGTLWVSPGSEVPGELPAGLTCKVIGSTDQGERAGTPVETPRQAADRIAARLLIPPTEAKDEETLAVAARYYKFLKPFDLERAEEYFLEAIARFVGRQQGNELRNKAGDRHRLPANALLVTSNTGGFGQLAIGPAAFEPWCVLLLVPPQDDNAKRRLESRLPGLAKQLLAASGAILERVEWPIRLDRFQESIPWLVEHIERMRQGQPVIIDLTPGQKLHTIALYEAAKALKCWCYYVNGIDPTSTRVLAWDLNDETIGEEPDATVTAEEASA